MFFITEWGLLFSFWYVLFFCSVLIVDYLNTLVIFYGDITVELRFGCGDINEELRFGCGDITDESRTPGPPPNDY